MKYFKMNKPGGRWTEIKGTDMLKVISAHFDETPSTNWDGTQKPSRQQVADHIHNGNVLHLYTADYKAEEDNQSAAAASLLERAQAAKGHGEFELLLDAALRLDPTIDREAHETRWMTKRLAAMFKERIQPA